jgi:hypothetical protein
MRYFLIVFNLFLFFVLNVNASPSNEGLLLHSNYPMQYVIKPGDTLWRIASTYLKKPWQWQALWRANPRIKNPNHLYPGDIIYLHYANNRPYLTILSNGTIKLSPHLRPTHIDNEILPIPLDEIRPFLNNSIIMDENLLINAPYVVAFRGEHLLGSQGDEVFVKKLYPKKGPLHGTTISYAIYRPGYPYREHITNRLIGYKATLVGYGELVQGGEPATLLLTDIVEGITVGDRVMVNDFPEFKLNFLPKTPRYPIEGTIIDLPPNFTQGAVGLVAIIDKGDNAGLESGDVLGIYAPSYWIPDALITSKSILIPRERVGEAMIFRTFSQTSLALVVRSIRTIHLMDIVTNP